jgi:hypothetical protein
MDKIILENIFESENEPILTVALPVYNSKKIAWVCLEGLIKQENIERLF